MLIYIQDIFYILLFFTFEIGIDNTGRRKIYINRTTILLKYINCNQPKRKDIFGLGRNRLVQFRGRVEGVDLSPIYHGLLCLYHIYQFRTYVLSLRENKYTFSR